MLDLSGGWKIDLIIQKSRPFSITEFDRRVEVDVQGMRLHTATAEDVVLSKLEWAKVGASKRQIEDAAGILKIRSAELDRNYIEHWVQDLALQEQWLDALRIAGP